MIIRVPIKIISPNVKEHWTKPYFRNKKYKMLIKSEFYKLKPRPQLPITVTFVRIAPRPLDGHDNLCTACKGVTDIIADLIIPGKPPGQADGDPRFNWKYEQRKGNPKEYALEIKFTGFYPDPLIL